MEDILGIVSIWGFTLIIIVILLEAQGKVKFKSVAFGLLLLSVIFEMASTLLDIRFLEVIGDYSLSLAFIVHFYKQQTRKSIKAALFTLVIVFILEQVIANVFNITYLNVHTRELSLVGLAVLLGPPIVVYLKFKKYD